MVNDSDFQLESNGFFVPLGRRNSSSISPSSRHIERMGSSEVETLKVQLREADSRFG